MRWLILWPYWLLVTVVSFIASAVLPKFAKNVSGPIDNNNGTAIEPRLVGWLSLFQTPDNSLLGDNTYKRLNDGGYWSQVRWLMRNPACGFKESFPLVANIHCLDSVSVYGNKDIRDGDKGVSGWCLTRVDKYWSLLLIYPITSSMAMHFTFGWELKTYAEDSTRLLDQSKAQYVFSPRFSHFKKE